MLKRESANDDHGALAIKLEFALRVIYALGCVGVVYLGYRLFVLGVTGQASIVLERSSLKGQLINAAPGLFFAVGGISALILLIWRASTIVVESVYEDDREA